MKNRIKTSNKFFELFVIISVLVFSINAYSISYNYDSINRLTSATIDGSYVEYVYDKAGNLLETKTPHTITVTVLGAGTVTDNRNKIDCGEDCVGVYGNNTSATLTATPDVGNTFSGWSGSGCSGTSTCTINVTVQHAVQAIFSGTSGSNAPIFTATGPFNIDENSANGSFVGNIDANDGDGGANDAGLAYSITGGTGQNVFSISNTGILIVSNSTALDYEATTNFSLTVNAYDGSLNTNTNVVINVNDLPEITAPVITAPSNGSTINLTTPQMEGTGQPSATVTVSGPQQQTCSALVAGNGFWTCTLSPSLPQGSNTLYASQVSSIGQTSPTSSVTITVNGMISEPAPVILTPDNNANIAGNNFIVSGTSQPGIGLQVSVYAGATLINTYCGATYGNGLWSCLVTSLPYGTYTVNAYHYNTNTSEIISPQATIVVNLIDPVLDTIFKNSYEGDTVVMFVNNLNDTGVVFGANDSGNNAACTSTITAPQDCHQGRDNTLNDDSDGHAGFDFTKLDASGNPLAANAATWSCVKDNVTDLVWEVKTDDGGIHDKDNLYKWGGVTRQGNGFGTYYPDWDLLVNTSNANSFCGYNDWRVPSATDLESIINFNRINPTIDVNYFPRTQTSHYWTSLTNSDNNQFAWAESFGNGVTSSRGRTWTNYVRLVR